MADTVLDCKNMPCPQPVIQVKRLLEGPPPPVFQVIVDNEPALENVSRFLAASGYTAASVAEGGTWRITATQGAGCEMADQIITAAKGKVANGEELKTLVLIITPVFGAGDDVLGAKLMKNFLATLPEFGPQLWRIVLLNGGVTLATEDSPAIGELKALEKSGVSILVCGTCLDHFKLLEKKAVGETTNMLDVVTSIQLAEKVVRI